jgi:hypothetical protein
VEYEDSWALKIGSTGNFPPRMRGYLISLKRPKGKNDEFVALIKKWDGYYQMVVFFATS